MTKLEKVLNSEKVYTIFLSGSFINNTRLNLAKNQAQTKQHHEAELLLFENDSLSSSTLLSENNLRFIVMKMRLTMENGLRRYDINRTRLRHRHKYTKYKMCLRMMIVTVFPLIRAGFK